MRRGQERKLKQHRCKVRMGYLRERIEECLLLGKCGGAGHLVVVVVVVVVFTLDLGHTGQASDCLFSLGFRIDRVW